VPVVRDFVNEQLAADEEALLMVAGDLNQAPLILARWGRSPDRVPPDTLTSRQFGYNKGYMVR